MSTKQPKKSDLGKPWGSPPGQPPEDSTGVSSDCNRGYRYRAGVFQCHQKNHQREISRAHTAKGRRSGRQYV